MLAVRIDRFGVPSELQIQEFPRSKLTSVIKS